MVTIRMARGTDKTIRAYFTDAASVAINLSSAVVKMLVKESMNDLDADAVVSKVNTPTAGTSVTSPGGGVVEAYLDPEDTEDLGQGKYFLDFRVLLSGGKVYVAPSPPAVFELRDRVTREF